MAGINIEENEALLVAMVSSQDFYVSVSPDLITVPLRFSLLRTGSATRVHVEPMQSDNGPITESSAVPNLREYTEWVNYLYEGAVANPEISPLLLGAERTPLYLAIPYFKSLLESTDPTKVGHLEILTTPRTGHGLMGVLLNAEQDTNIKGTRGSARMGLRIVGRP